MPLVTVLATGGTIATRTDDRGASTAQDSGADLLTRLGHRTAAQVRVRDVVRVGSYRMTLALGTEVARAVAGELADPEVTGVVVTHGTDTTEETAFLLDLFHADPRPVVLTGAQRPADAPDGDGPRNLADAIVVAASPAARDLGVLVSFGGRVFPARGTRKGHTLAADTFGAPDAGPLGRVDGDALRVERLPVRRPPFDLARFDPAGVRVDVVACHPDADATGLHAFAAAGARGIVLEATGAGNANPAICRAVGELTAAGVVVVTSTRVPAGPVAALYGDGGGTDLLAAGALPAGLLRPSQARVLLAVLLGLYADPDAVRAGWTAAA
ncbi:L-asparaginase [Geodermatophilus bullaregiensis]|uniref:asparaginase n=1 Tax=Geodermatophilus bullaregiensis TaxID=1564160 RepID=UPI00195A57EC|nr:asparaginase [Geodermatophilus bullaregiensis]MBM7805189.1 L-asparaginase [Geodermatophilus bullaregiensis]